jgi:hypothetical protein
MAELRFCAYQEPGEDAVFEEVAATVMPRLRAAG